MMVMISNKKELEYENNIFFTKLNKFIFHRLFNTLRLEGEIGILDFLFLNNCRISEIYSFYQIKLVYHLKLVIEHLIIIEVLQLMQVPIQFNNCFSLDSDYQKFEMNFF